MSYYPNIVWHCVDAGVWVSPELRFTAEKLDVADIPWRVIDHTQRLPDANYFATLRECKRWAADTIQRDFEQRIQ